MDNTNLYKSIFVLVSFLITPLGYSALESNISATKHNLSASPAAAPNTSAITASDGQSRICVFCHTPHGASTNISAPLWNRTLATGEVYTSYTSDSMDVLAANTMDPNQTTSKLCLSCHDGTIAIGKVNVVTNSADDIAMTGTNMPTGSGVDTGYTRNLGTDLSNDHPISFEYDGALATADKELYTPGSGTGSHIQIRAAGVNSNPAVPLQDIDNDTKGEVECTTCHDPHLNESVTTKPSIKFLRLNRFQSSDPSANTNFSTTNGDMICLACHNKDGWRDSAHARKDVANEFYDIGTDSEGALREFSSIDGSGNFAVWQAGCLNCHDTHSVQGSRKLLREGTDDGTVATPGTPKDGGTAAQEQACYQCHDGGVNGVLSGSPTTVPDIATDFASTYAMPIADTSEVHNVTDANLSEDIPNLARHAECTDCHNPHRVIKNQLFNAAPGTPDAAGTHMHDLGSNDTHSNIASGVLKGSWGIEPNFTNCGTNWDSCDPAASVGVKKGNPAIGASDAVSSTYVTREYQVCLKCHSSYAFGAFPPTTGPTLDTPLLANGLTKYTDQAKEFQYNSANADAGGTGDKGEDLACTAGADCNHRSWHPVVTSTGRTAAIRGGANANNWLAPWNDATATRVGNQTMYCSDCHGSAITTETVDPDVGVEDGKPWGPHGSSKPFILKGDWDTGTGTNTQTTDLCFKCHDYNQYANPGNAAPQMSGFRNTGGATNCQFGNMAQVNTNLHQAHAAKIGQLRCTWCHVAVPHGWKNKALLVDLSQDASCAGKADGTTQNDPCYSEPYIEGAYLGGGGAVTWAESGKWTANNCTSRAWMRSVCLNAP